MTISNNFYNEIETIQDIKLYKNVSLKNENNMKIDAIAACKIEIYSYLAAIKVFKIIKKYEYKYFILGGGSNVLLTKEYYDCLFLKVMPFYYKNMALVSAGASLNKINNYLINNGIESFNFLAGVPCSVGGAIYMNAGAFNKEIKDIIEYVYYLDIDECKIKVRSNIECNFSYRNSYFHNQNCLILGAKIRLLKNHIEDIKNNQKKYLNIRKDKFPLTYPNLGSIFKNTDKYFSGKLIEEMGLKGLEYRGAKISEKHANVIINCKQSTGKDVLKLIEIIEDLIYLKYKIILEREIIIFK